MIQDHQPLHPVELDSHRRRAAGLIRSDREQTRYVLESRQFRKIGVDTIFRGGGALSNTPRNGRVILFETNQANGAVIIAVAVSLAFAQRMSVDCLAVSLPRSVQSIRHWWNRGWSRGGNRIWIVAEVVMWVFVVSGTSRDGRGTISLKAQETIL